MTPYCKFLCRLACVVGTATMPFGQAAAQAHKPDPITLLEGVYAARLQIPPSRLRIAYKAYGRVWTFDGTFDASFEGNKCRIDQINPEPRLKTIYNGDCIVKFDVNRQITIQDRKEYASSCPDIFFDARLLGLTFLNPSDLLPGIPQFRAFQRRYETVGREVIRGRPVWHVSVRAPEEYDLKDDY